MLVREEVFFCCSACALSPVPPSPFFTTAQSCPPLFRAIKSCGKGALACGCVYVSAVSHYTTLGMVSSSGEDGSAFERAVSDVIRFFLDTGIVLSLVKLKFLSERDNVCLYYLLSATSLGSSILNSFLALEDTF